MYQQQQQLHNINVPLLLEYTKYCRSKEVVVTFFAFKFDDDDDGDINIVAVGMVVFNQSPFHHHVLDI